MIFSYPFKISDSRHDNTALNKAGNKQNLLCASFLSFLKKKPQKN